MKTKNVISLIFLIVMTITVGFSQTTCDWKFNKRGTGAVDTWGSTSLEIGSNDLVNQVTLFVNNNVLHNLNTPDSIVIPVAEGGEVLIFYPSGSSPDDEFEFQMVAPYGVVFEGNMGMPEYDRMNSNMDDTLTIVSNISCQSHTETITGNISNIPASFKAPANQILYFVDDFKNDTLRTATTDVNGDFSVSNMKATRYRIMADGLSNTNPLEFEIHKDVTNNPFNLKINGSSTDLIIDNGTGISDSNVISEAPLSAFPNPSSDGVFYLNKITNFIVLNSIGESVASDFGNKVDISEKSNGVYFLKTEKETVKVTMVR